MFDLNEVVFYWHRKNPIYNEPVAVGPSSLDSNYRVTFDKSKGVYDLRILNAQYDRDNSQFECKIKEPGSGVELKSRTYVVTILSKCTGHW